MFTAEQDTSAVCINRTRRLDYHKNTSRLFSNAIYEIVVR